MAANSQTHIFAFGHLPAFSAYHTNTLALHPAERNAFWNSLAAAGARVYFDGHDHFYNHARLDDGDGNPYKDVHQVMVGTGGDRLYTWEGIYAGDTGSWVPQGIYYERDYGYTLVEIDGPQATLTWKHRVSPGVYQAAGEVFSYTVPPTIPLSGVLIDGPATALVDTDYSYAALVSPVDATLPVTYTWTPPPAGGPGTATASYRWSVAGSETIDVAAQNAAGVVTATYAVTVTVPISVYYFPVVFKETSRLAGETIAENREDRGKIE